MGNENRLEDEVVLKRTFDAPRALVFDAWTKAEHFARWFGPHGVEIPSCTIEPRPGGTLRFCHRLEGGTELWVEGTFREVVRPSRLVFVLGFVTEEGEPTHHPSFPDWPLDATIVTTVILEEASSKTRLEVRQVVRPEAVAKNPTVRRERELARQGWGQTLERLEAHLRTGTAASSHAK